MSQLGGAGPAGDSAVSVGEGVGASGARSHTVILVRHQPTAAGTADLGGSHSRSHIDQSEVIDLAGSRDGEDEASVDGGGEGEGVLAGEVDEGEAVEDEGGLVESAADVGRGGSGVLALHELAAVGAEGGSGGGGEHEEAEPSSAQSGLGAERDPGSDLGALEIGGTDGDLEEVGSAVETVEEDADDGVGRLGDGGEGVGVDESAVALGVRGEGVCVADGVPTRKLPSWISGLLLAQKFTRTRDQTALEKSNWKLTVSVPTDAGNTAKDCAPT